ncbi:unnamed protein product [Brassica rapa subsp. trilocularis]
MSQSIINLSKSTHRKHTSESQFKTFRENKNVWERKGRKGIGKGRSQEAQEGSP